VFTLALSTGATACDLAGFRLRLGRFAGAEQRLDEFDPGPDRVVAAFERLLKVAFCRLEIPTGHVDLPEQESRFGVLPLLKQVLQVDFGFFGLFLLHRLPGLGEQRLGGVAAAGGGQGQADQGGGKEAAGRGHDVVFSSGYRHEHVAWSQRSPKRFSRS
jgi:hypothetical protein